MAAGSGLSAAADLTITNTIIALATNKYQDAGNDAGTGANWWALYTTQFTAATKAGATEWLAASDTAPYARQPMGAAGVGWTVTAYASGVGVVWKNTNTLTQPAVLGAGQTLFAIGFCNAVTAGVVDTFIDLGASQAVNIGTAVILTAATGAVFTTY
jgi:hypothetical protein